MINREERIEKMFGSKQKKIIAMMNNPMVINNHTDKPEKLTGLVEFVNPEKGLACCFDASYYSLNLCTIEDGELHCSQMSIGGLLWGAYPDSEQITKYNDEHQLFPGDRIKCIYRPDGTVILPDDGNAELASVELKHLGIDGLRIAN